MLRLSVACSLLIAGSSAVFADDLKEKTRPITEADSVLAVYREDWGLASRGDPALILAVWPDGHIVWSGDRVSGGAPYRAGHIEPRKVTTLLSRLDKDGLFADEKLNQAHFGADSQFITVLVKSGKKQVNMQSWHELFEVSEKLVGTSGGASTLNGSRRLDVLRKEPADYLYFRFVWSETRGRLADLAPADSSPVTGKTVMKAGVLSWREAEGKSEKGGAADPSKK